MLARIRQIWSDESGQGMVEYGLILALVAVVVIGVLSLMGDSLKELFSGISGKLTVEEGGGGGA